MRSKESLEERCQRLFRRPLREMLPILLEEEGKNVFKVAIRLETYPTSIRYWMRVFGIEIGVTRQVKVKEVMPDA